MKKKCKIKRTEAKSINKPEPDIYAFSSALSIRLSITLPQHFTEH